MEGYNQYIMASVYCFFLLIPFPHSSVAPLHRLQSFRRKSAPVWTVHGPQFLQRISISLSMGSSTICNLWISARAPGVPDLIPAFFLLLSFLLLPPLFLLLLLLCPYYNVLPLPPLLLLLLPPALPHQCSGFAFSKYVLIEASPAWLMGSAVSCGGLWKLAGINCVQHGAVPMASLLPTPLHLHPNHTQKKKKFSTYLHPLDRQCSKLFKYASMKQVLTVSYRK